MTAGPPGLTIIGGLHSALTGRAIHDRSSGPENKSSTKLFASRTTGAAAFPLLPLRPSVQSAFAFLRFLGLLL